MPCQSSHALQAAEANLRLKKILVLPPLLSSEATKAALVNDRLVLRRLCLSKSHTAVEISMSLDAIEAELLCTSSAEQWYSNAISYEFMIITINNMPSLHFGHVRGDTMVLLKHFLM